MDLIVLDNTLTATIPVDTFESLIWTERYSAYGDFELYTPVSFDVLTQIQTDYYLYSRNSKRVMIVEGINIEVDIEDGAYCQITGRSLESILDRRVILADLTLTGNFQDSIQQLLNDNIINPTNTNRKIDNFIFEVSVDPLVTALTLEYEYKMGANLYTIINELCTLLGVGFIITLTDDNNFNFKLYAGVDRSYEQLTTPYVIFSPNFNNLITSTYYENKRALRTLAIVGATLHEVSASVVTGLSRREIFVTANDTSLDQQGNTALSENCEVGYLEGEVTNSGNYIYGDDFSMGDIVELENEYGLTSRSRVTEVIRSQSLSEESLHPTFTRIIE